MQPDLAEVFKRLAEAEQRESRRGRIEGLRAAHDRFYKGDIAESIILFAGGNNFPDASGNRHAGLLAREDLSGYSARIEKPVTVNYRGHDVYKCGPWSQGPVFLQQLNILEGFDTASLGHNSPEYVHLLVETAKLALPTGSSITAILTLYLSPGYTAVKGICRGTQKTYRSWARLHGSRPGNAPSHNPEVKKGNPKVYTGDTTHLDAVY